jgi:hypothetical protein
LRGPFRANSKTVRVEFGPTTAVIGVVGHADAQDRPPPRSGVHLSRDAGGLDFVFGPRIKIKVARKISESGCLGVGEVNRAGVDAASVQPPDLTRRVVAV